MVRKSRYSGFCRTDLEAYLRAAGIRYLLFTGVATNVCVESTARDAFMREFWPILVEDAMNNSGPDFNRQATLWNFEYAFGWLINTDQVVEALEAETRVPQPACPPSSAATARRSGERHARQMQASPCGPNPRFAAAAAPMANEHPGPDNAEDAARTSRLRDWCRVPVPRSSGLSR